MLSLISPLAWPHINRTPSLTQCVPQTQQPPHHSYIGDHFYLVEWTLTQTWDKEPLGVKRKCVTSSSDENNKRFDECHVLLNQWSHLPPLHGPICLKRLSRSDLARR